MADNSESGAPAAPTRVRPRMPAALGYGLAVASVVAATLLMYGLYDLLGIARGSVPFIFYFGAVIVSARYGGRGPGLLSILLSAIVANYLFLPPFGGFVFDRAAILQVCVFVLVSLFISQLTQRSARAELAAHEAGESLSTTLRSIGDGVIATDASGRVTLMNPVAERLTGWREAEAQGRDLAEVFRIVNETTGATVESPAALVLREGVVQGLANHTILVSRAGARTPIDDSGAPILDRNGRLVGVVMVFHDISERRRAEAALSRREAELTDFIENATVGLHWVGADGTILWANRAELEMLGYTADEYIGHNISEFHADAEVIADILHRLTCRDELHNYEARLLGKDGSIRHVIISSNVLWNEAGEFVHTRCFTRDITDRHKAATDAARLAAIVESSDDAIIGKDLDGRITSWNRGAERVYGYTAEEVVGRHISVIAPPELASELEDILRHLRAGQLVKHYETTRVRKDGTRIQVSLTISPIIDESGRIAGASTIARDITEQQRAEQLLRDSERQLQLVTDNAPVFISYCDTEQRFRFVNRPYAERFGLTPDEIVGRTISEVIGDEAHEAIRPHIEAALAGRRIEFEMELPYRDIGRHYVDVEYVPHEDADGRVVGFVAVINDISDRKRSEEERDRLLELEQTARAAAEEAAARTARLQSVTAALSEALTPAEVASVIVEHGLTSLGATGGAVVARNEDVAGELELIGSAGLPSSAVEKWRRFPLSTRVPTAEAVRTGHDVLISSIEDWLRRNPATGLLGELDGIGAMVAVPLVIEGRSVGAIGLSFPTPRRFDDEDTAFLHALARQCAQALDRARLYEAERRARLEIESSEHRYRALADSMPQIVWTARADGFMDYYNRRWYEYTGTTPGQTEGWGWQPVLHPDDVEHSLRRWSRSVVTGEEYEIEQRFRCAEDGEYRWHLARAEPLRDAEGRVVKWFGTATDIHDQKRAADRLRTLAEASALLASSLDYEATLEGLARLTVSVLADYCLIDLIDPKGEVTRVATTHADPAREELVRRLRDFPPDMTKDAGVPHVLHTGRAHITPDVSEDVLRSVARGEEHYRLLRELGLRSFMTVPLIARERTIGALTLGSSAASRHYGPDDLSFVEEIAGRAALAIDNARLYREARNANRTKDEFLATLSHELRTPLTPIIGWTHMMKAGRLPAQDAAHGLDVIENNAHSLTRLINDLLDMSSILSGKMSIERAPVDLEQTVAEAVETVRPQAEQRGVALEFAAPPGAARWIVSGDRTRLVQVFWNLLNNAVKFSVKGGRVRVSCAGTNGHARVEVTDDGAGIPKEFLPYVFERFRQADGSTTREHGGLGIGLSLVKSFTEAHGGVVTVESRGPGAGSSFVVSLPLLPVADAESRTDEETADEGSAIRHPPSAIPSKGRVLVVEDARDTLDMLEVAFAAHGYEPVMCASAAEALRVAADVCFDIIVSDIGLPQLDGYDLIGLLREIEHLRKVPAVALTGYASARDAEAALEAGFDLHLPKPVDPMALISAVERLLEERERRGVDRSDGVV